MSRQITTQSVLAPKLRRAALSCLLVMALMLAAIPALATAEESEFVSLINQSRAAQGLGPLSDFWDLTDDARVHTAEMIAAGQIYHSSNAQLSAYTTGWSKLGENVGMGPNPTLLHQAFMNSAGHRANILGDFDRVGVGAARNGDGTLFVTVLFMKSSAPAPTTTTTTPPPTTIAPPPTTTTTAPPPTTGTTLPPTTAPPTTGTTLPPTTTTAPPTPSTSTTGTSPTATGTSPTATGTSAGDRPATRVANVRTERPVERFRPLFSLLEDSAADGPIIRFTPSGVLVTIE